MTQTNVIVRVFLPFAALGCWAAYLWLTSAYGVAVELPVAGFDPRDLLAGHYLTYAVDYGRSVCSNRADNDRCVCFSASKPASVVWDGECSAMPQDRCTVYLRGRCSWRGFEAGIERYYIPESFSASLSRVPQKSTIEVRINGFGQGVVTKFFVDGVPLLDYARKR
jgi:uncharacterized membrane-anchored protein